MKIEFSNEELKQIVQAHAERILNVEIDDNEEVTVEMNGYGSYSITASVSIEKRATTEPELKVAA
jgi:hypothetical protein